MCLVCTVYTDVDIHLVCVLCVIECVCVHVCNVEGVEKGALLGEAERGEMTGCQSELTVTAQCFSAS